jgi:hypothetical protein
MIPFARYRRQCLNQTIAEARDKFADMAPDELDALLEEAVKATRLPSSAG